MSDVTTTGESLNSSKMITEMKSIQPFSTKDEYLYAMKEDLAEWFNSMYLTRISAENFIEQLENGVIICNHANSVMKEALKVCKFDAGDLINAGLLSVLNNSSATSLNSTMTARSDNKHLLTPNSKMQLQWSGDYLLFRTDARAQSFQARDNIANFIKWCRFIVKVRECLMFETEDLILRKNEKNFILCLLEVARYGSRFGIQVPTLIKLEQEIEAEIEREKTTVKQLPEPLPIPPPPVVQHEHEHEQLTSTATVSTSCKTLEINMENKFIESSNATTITTTTTTTTNTATIAADFYEDKKLNSNGSYDSSSLSNDESMDDLNCLSSNQNEEEDDDDFEEEDKNKSFNDSLENINYINDQHDQNEHNFHNGNQRNLDINTSNTTTTTITTTNLIQSDVLDQQEQLAIISRRRSNENHDTDNNNNNNNKNDDELDQTKTMDVNLLNLKDNLNINVNLTMNENSEENQAHPNTNSNTNSDDLDSDNDDDVKRKQQDTQLKSNSSFGNTSPLIPSPLSTSISSNSSLNCLQMSSVPNMAAIPSIQLTSPTGGDVQNEICHQETNEPEPEKPTPTVESLPPPAPTSRVAKNLNDMFFVKEKQSPTQCNRHEELIDPSATKSKNSLRSRSNSRESGLNNVDNIYQSVTNLHRHVCSIADRCTCEKQFPVVKIGEGKYRIGNTKNIVFIRILRNHIMVRVGGGWDTLENYLNKHDPCRCVSDVTHSGLKSKNSDNSLLSDHNHHHHHHHHSNNNTNNNHQSSNILLTPVNSTNLATTASSINTTTSTLNATLPSSSTNNLITVVPTNSTTLITPLKTTSNNQFINKTPYSSSSHHHHCNFHHHHHYQRSTVDFTDAKLVIERNTDGKHVVGKILLTNPSNTSNISDESSILNKSISNSNLNLSNLNATSSGKSILYASTAISSKVDIARNNNNNKNNNNNNSNLNNNNNCEEMNGMVRNSNFITPSKHINNNNSNNFQQQPKQNVLNSQYNNNNNSTYQMASHFQQQQKQTNKPQFMPNSNSLNAIQSYLIQGPMTPQPASAVKHQVSATFHTPNPPQMQVNLTTLGSSTSGGRTDSLLKNKMKKLINKLPNQMSGSTVTVSARGGMSPARKSTSSMSANSTNSSNNNNKHQQQHALMDGGSNTTTTTGYSSLNDDSSSDFLDMTNNHQSVPLKVYNESDLPARLLLRNTPVYTETVLPPRLLRKYEKKRAITEAIVDTSSSSMTVTSTTMHPNTTSTETDSSGVDSVSNMSSPPLPLADVEEKAAVTNEHYDENDEEDDLDDRPLSFTKINASSSPQAPPRTKKKYRKSKTTDLTRILKAEAPLVSAQAKPAHEDIDEDDADSLESDYRYEGKLNNSLTAKQFQQQSSTTSETNNDRVDDEDEELTKLNDSLESLSHNNNSDIMKKLQATTIKNDHDEILNDAELTDLLSGTDDAINKQQQPGRRLSSSSSMSNLADNDSDGLGMTTDQNTNQSSSSSSSSSKRAQWDKTAVQQFDYKSQLNFQRQKHTPTKSRAQSSNVTADLTVRPNTPKSMLKQTPQVVAHLKATINHGTGGGSNTQLSAKKARNLNMAKAQLYEMKKTIDAKVNLDKLTTTGGSTSNLYTGRATPVRLDQKPTGAATPSSTAAFGRTTPRKVKKRSGERSLTTGLFSPNSSHLELPKNPVVTKKPVMTSRSPAPTNVSNRLSRPTSSSLHNIVLSLNETASTPNGHKARYRRDSCASSASSGTCFSAGAANLSFNLSAFSPQLDYKENKASELRKKSALFNKIINKTQQFDPIYTRSHPICTEINEQQAVNAIHNETAVNYLLANATNIGSYEQHSARRRLFTKKSERFDPNVSLGSNASSSTSTTSSSANVKPAYAAPKLSYMKPTISSNINNIHHVNNNNNNKPRSINSTARSKSNSDIYYTLERTNSTQDLIELMNNCEPPAGDVNRYKLMLDECEKLDRTKSTGAKPSIRTLKAARRAPTTDLNETITSTTNHNNRQLERSNSNNSINKHRRTHSLPSYAFDIPDIKIDLCDDDH